MQAESTHLTTRRIPDVQELSRGFFMYAVAVGNSLPFLQDYVETLYANDAEMLRSDYRELKGSGTPT
jgi:hypothetical protein